MNPIVFTVSSGVPILIAIPVSDNKSVRFVTGTTKEEVTFDKEQLIFEPANHYESMTLITELANKQVYRCLATPKFDAVLTEVSHDYFGEAAPCLTIYDGGHHLVLVDSQHTQRSI